MRIAHTIIIFCLLITLGACEIQGGVERPTPSQALAPTVAQPLATVPVEAATSPTPAAARDGGLRIGMLGDPGELLPYYSDSSDERSSAPIVELLFPAPLLALSYSYTTTGVLERVPSLANGDVSLGTVDVFLDPAGTITTTATTTITQVQQISVTYRWDRNLIWSDGTPLTASDSVFAYELAQQVSLGQEANARLDLLARYEQVDDYTTRAVLKPDFTDPAYLTAFWPPLPRHVLAGRDPAELRSGDFALMPVSYGPYMVDRRDQGSLRLVRNPHASPPAPIETITFIFRDDLELLRSSVVGGSLDVVFLEQPQAEIFSALRDDAAQGRLAMSTTPGPIWEHLDFNLDVPLLQDFRVRRAFGYAIDRQGMVDRLLGGYSNVLDSWIVPGQWAAAPADQLTRYPYNPDEARRLLDEASLLDSDGDGMREAAGEPITVTLVTTAGSPLRLASAEAIRANMAEVGIAIDVVTLPTAELYSPDGPLFRRTFELTLFAWIAGPDPRGWERWSCTGVPNETNGWVGNNFPGWCFFEADQAIRVATTALDQTERSAAYLRQQQLFTQELPVLPLFQRVDLTLSAPGLMGVRPDPTAPFTWNLTEWQRQ